MTALFWINEPSILLNNKYISQLLPTGELTKEEKYNAITRMIILMTFLGYLIKRSKQIIYVGILIIISIICLYKMQSKEGFDTMSKKELYGLIRDNYQEPTKKNPLCNVLVGDDPKRKAAPPSYFPPVEKVINERTKEMITKNLDTTESKLFKDLGDNMEFEHSMRSWYATPNTQIPNNQKLFADFCYGDMTSVKEQ
tara:strand:- start:604 stop:1194 length:591 start_codon:yes stop_codon:yes gene_type:complete